MLSLFQRFGLGTRKNRYPGASIGGSTSVRVLQLRAIQDDQIHCKLRVIDITACDDTAYDALSYRWGDVADPKLIYCNGVPFTVQQSLYKALLQIWSQAPGRLIWVDAICIDQNNVAELSSQVKIMGAIYQRARLVIIWLGEADEFTDLAWRALLEALSPAPDAVDDLEARLARMADLEEIWLSLHNLGQREWFYRAWTFQELYLAQNATVLCSGYSMDWGPFHRALGRLAEVLHVTAASHFSIKAKTTLQRLLGSVAELRVSDAAYTLTDLLSRTVHRSCDEPKDRIYALLGVLFHKEGRDHSGDGIPIDYTSSSGLVYTRVSHALAMRSAWTEPGRAKSEPLDLSILHGAGMDAHNRRYRTSWFKGLQVNKKLGELPSWVTDWTDHEAAFSWAEQTYLQRHKWRPIINTDGLKLSAAVNLHDSRVDFRALLLYGVAIARLVPCKSESDDYISFYLEDLPRCICHGSLLSSDGSSNGTYPFSRWTSETPVEDQGRYPSDSPSRIYYAPKLLRRLPSHDQKRCECAQAPFSHTLIAATVALIVSVIYRVATPYILIVVCWIAFKDTRIMAGRPSRNFRLDIAATKDHPTVASKGDWVVSLAGEQGLFLLKPSKDGKFKLVRGLLRREDAKPGYEVSRVDANGNKLAGWTSRYPYRDHSPSTTPSWRDFRVLPISLSIT